MLANQQKKGVAEMLDKIMWYPWLKCIIKSCLNGEIKDRLPIASANKRTLSIVLNGPSVNRTIKYLDSKETDIMMVNGAPITPLYKELNPKYMCFCDAAFAKKSNRTLKIRRELLQSKEKPMIFLPHYLKGQNIYSGGCLNVKFVFSPHVTSQYNVYSHRLMRMNLMAPSYNNVAIMCLHVGIQLGYKKIYLYGADENFVRDIVVDKNNRVMRIDRHYYGEEKICENRMHGFDMEIMMYMMYMIFKGLKQLKRYAQEENVRIMNMSDDSWIDCFERFEKQ